jgi:ABC-type bacteriocin/lantibiotic exporter with double-glycine peptidase domain
LVLYSPNLKLTDFDLIQLNQVSFKYDSNGKDVLSQVNLTIRKGDKIAIHGKSGEGKSTLVKLITGLCKPSQGTIAFSGVPMLL